MKQRMTKTSKTNRSRDRRTDKAGKAIVFECENPMKSKERLLPNRLLLLVKMSTVQFLIYDEVPWYQLTSRCEDCADQCIPKCLHSF